MDPSDDMIEEYFQYNEWLAPINGATFSTALGSLVCLGCCALVIGERNKPQGHYLCPSLVIYPHSSPSPTKIELLISSFGMHTAADSSGHNDVDAVVCMALSGVFSLAAAIMWGWVYGAGSVSRLLRAHEMFLMAEKAKVDAAAAARSSDSSAAPSSEAAAEAPTAAQGADASAKEEARLLDF